MDTIDKIFKKLKKEQAPHSLRAKVLDIPAAKAVPSGFPAFFKFAVPALLIVAIAGGFFYAQYWRVPQARASFELSAEQATDAGIAAGSSFILTSSAKLSTFQIKQIVKFSPEVDFSVESAGDKRYKITPKGSLSENEIYKVTIAEGPGDHDYSWAYQVKAAFQVISTVPGNRGHNVPQATGIEMNLNREGVISPEQFFEITPSVAGTFEQNGATLIFRPAKPLEAGKVYTVTLKKGLATKNTKETLVADYTFSFETDLAGGNSYNVVNFADDFVDVVQKRPVFQAYYNNNTPDKPRGTVYQFANPEEFIATYRDSDSWQNSWSYYNNGRAPKDLASRSVQKVLEYELTFSSSNNNQYTEIPQDLSDGYYLLEVAAGPARNYIWFQKTPVAHYASYTFNRSLVWLYDFTKKQPLANVPVQLPDGGALGATDSQGLAQYDTPKIFQDNDRPDATGYVTSTPNISVVKANGYNPYYIVQSYNYFGIHEGSRYWEHLSTDRPLYQLSDSMQFWGIVRPRDEIKTPETVKVSLYKGYVYNSFFRTANITTQPIITAEVPVSDYSTYEGSLNFAGLTADTYTIVASTGDYVISTQTVLVTSFSKPSYQLTASTSRNAYNTGENIAFHVAAKFYDDTPVPNLELAYSGYWMNGNITGTVVTDSRGEATVNLTLPYRQDTPDQQQYWPQSFSLNFVPQKAEEAFISKSTYVTVVGPKVSLEVENKVGKDSTNTFTATARAISTSLFENIGRDNSQEYRQAPVLANQKITANVKKTTYTPRQTGEYYDFIDKVTRPTYTYDKAETMVDTLSGTTDGNGVWKFDKKYNYEPNVVYSLYFEATDKDGKIARSTSSYLFSETPYFYNDNSTNPNGLQPALTTAKNEYYASVNLGESMQFNLQFNNAAKAGEAKPTKVMYYSYQRDILKAAITDDLTYTDTFAQAMSPAVSYTAVVLGPVGFEEANSVSALMNTKSAELKVEVVPDKEQYRPGDTVNATIKVTDSKGEAGKGTVYLSVVDEAVFDATEYDYPIDTLGALYKYVIERPAVSMTQYATSPRGDGGGGGGPTSPRSKFLDTVFAKSVELGGNGEAKVSFALPQNLTSWRITAQAFDSKSVRAGSSITNISTGLPLFADLSMSNVYVKGDEPQFRVRVYGKQYDSGKPTHITVNSVGLSIKYDQTIDGNVAYIPASSLPVGQYPIEVKVSQGDLSDGLVRTVNVLDSSLTVPKVASYKLGGDLKDIAGNSSGLTEIVAIDTGRGKQFAAASMLAGQGGGRFDQRASSYFAQTLLHDVYGLPLQPEKFDPAIFQSKRDYNPLIGSSEQFGLGLFAYGDSDLRVSALGAALIPGSLPKDNLVKYFNDALRDAKADSHRISQALLGLAAYNQPVLAKLQLIKDDPAFDLEDKMFIANALAVFGDKETARVLYYKNIKPELASSDGQLYLKDGDETRQAKLTALAGMLASQLNIADDRDQLVLYLANHPAKKDLTSLEQALIVKSALEYAPKETASFSYKTDKRNGSADLKNGSRFNLQLLPDELKSLQFSNVSGDMQLLSWYNGSLDPATKPNLDIPLKRDYSVNGKSGTAFKDGDLVKVTVVAEPKAGIGRNEVFQITDILPGGLRPVTPSYYGGIMDAGPYLDPCNPVFSYPDNIDGNKISFTIQRFGLNTSCGTTQTMRVIYYARVSGFGTFRADPAVLTSLDDPSQFSLGPTQTIKISQ